MATCYVFTILWLFTLFESFENSELCQNMAIKNCTQNLKKIIQGFEERTQDTKFTECTAVQVR